MAETLLVVAVLLDLAVALVGVGYCLFDLLPQLGQLALKAPLRHHLLVGLGLGVSSCHDGVTPEWKVE